MTAGKNESTIDKSRKEQIMKIAKQGREYCSQTSCYECPACMDKKKQEWDDCCLFQQFEESDWLIVAESL